MPNPKSAKPAAANYHSLCFLYSGLRWGKQQQLLTIDIARIPCLKIMAALR
jgi:hypothetical protein